MASIDQMLLETAPPPQQTNSIDDLLAQTELPPQQSNSIDDLLAQTEPRGLKKYDPFLGFKAFGQALADVPATQAGGLQVYTPGEGLGLDPLLQKTSEVLKSMRSDETKSLVEQASEGKMWPTEEGQPWYQVRPEFIPEVMNTWAAMIYYI